MLSPTSVSPNPAQGTSQTFNATIHYATAPAGTQVVFNVTGANPQIKQVATNANGQASFGYTASHQGVDTITATTTVGSNALISNQAVVTWGAGSDTTFLSLNQSPKGAAPGQTVSLIASLTDASRTPATPLSGETNRFFGRRPTLQRADQRARYRYLSDHCERHRNRDSDREFRRHLNLARLE